MVEEKIFVLNLRKQLVKTPKWERSKRAIGLLRQSLEKKLKTNKIKIDSALNKHIWCRGGKNPPTKIRLRIVKEGDTFKVYLAK